MKGKAALHASVDRAMTDWPAMNSYAQYHHLPGYGIPQSPMGREHKQVTPPELKLDPPEDGRLSDEFLRTVAVAYEAAIAQRRPPAKTLGKIAGVSDRTVHLCVYLARKRGLMAPAKHKGRVT